MESQGRGLIKALENWAKKTTNGYRDVNVRDMSSSFRDGLAFCAIIHKYRPDLLDFDTLSKENILENNQLAFSVAEKQLGVPALLDAEDMVNFPKPDRLSIITYLSQLHNCFENQNKVRPGFKRLQNNNVSGPPSKILAAEPKLLSARRIEVCQVCNNRVFILERLIVEGKLYHTTCFTCCKCKALLNPGAYIESDIPGKYECTVCLLDEKVTNMDTDDTESVSSLEEKNYSPKLDAKPFHTFKNDTKSPLSESVTVARSSFLLGSLSPKSSYNRVSLSKLNGVSSNTDKLESQDENDFPSNGVSVKDKISVFESTKKPNADASKSQRSSPCQLKESPTFNRNSLDNSSNKSPKPSVRLSLLHSETSDQKEISFEKTDGGKTPVPSVINKTDCISKSDISAALKVLSPNSDSYKISNDNSNCDNISSESIDRISSPVKETPSEEKSPVLKTFIKNTDKSNEPYKHSISEYKSPLKTSRDIFKTNIQPLKLTIPTISSITKSESSSLPGTPLISSGESMKSPSEIAQIRSTYNKYLSRPLSFPSSQDKQKCSEISLDSPSVMLRDEQNGTFFRRKSLDSEKSSNFTTGSSSEPPKNVSYPEIVSKEDQFSKEQNNFKNISVSSPIPSVRLSLDTRKLEVKNESEKSLKETSFSASTSIKHLKKESDDNTPTNSPSYESTSPVPVLAKPLPSASSNQAKTEKEYPDDLNPFGDDEEEKEEEYPDDLNPFGDDDEEPPKVFEGVSADNYDESKNPFASDEEESETTSFNTPSPRPTISQNTSPFGTLSSPTGSLYGTTKKRKAPQPPKMSDIFPNGNSDLSSSRKSSPAVNRKLVESPSKVRKNKPAPPPPPVAVTKQTTHNANGKVSSSGDDFKGKSPVSKEPRKKKRPAPPVPIPMQKDRKKIPLKEIIREMKEIEAKQREFEKQGREIELLIRDRDKDEEPSVEEEEYIMQLFELVNQKNALFRRQAELMYIKRSQRLEEQQEDLEKQIRELMSKPDDEKTDEEKAREEELIHELTDIVDQRNSIIDSIEMDRRRELEEDFSVQEQIEMKNGDLPIAAEIKEKNKDKDKKDKKEKKEKKKKEKKKDKHKDKSSDNGENGKTTLRRKLFK